MKLFRFAFIPVITTATNKDHGDVHYLFKLRKAMKLLAGEEALSGLTEEQLIEIHTAIVKSLIDTGKGHWYEDWEPELDDTLPEDLKLASSGYYPPKDSGVFDLEDDEIEYRKLLEENDAISLWTAPTKRKEVPSGHFLDPKEKKYPFKNPDGSVNCKGLSTALAYAKGARGAPKRPGIAAKAQRLLNKHCKSKEKKAEDIRRCGKLINLKGDETL